MKTIKDEENTSNAAYPPSPTHEPSDNESLLKQSSVRWKEEQHRLSKTQSRRHLLKLLVIGILFCWTGYQLFLSEWNTALVGEQRAWLSDCLSHLRPESIRIEDLPQPLLPTMAMDKRSRRLIIVGDIHGMKESLETLLEEVKFNREHDHLILVGDLVAKGPDSAGVLDLAMSLGATCVRGNHEDQVVQAWDDMHEEERHSTYTKDSNQTISESTVYDSKHKILAGSLGSQRIEWIKTWPIILRVGNMGDLGEVIVTHAGLEPGVALEDQDPFMVMNMRSVRHGVLTDKHNGKVWTKKWNKYQKTLDQSQRQTVIYGHDAKRGLRINKYSLGIDSGCVKGKELTATILEKDENGFSHSLVQIKC